MTIEPDGHRSQIELSAICFNYETAPTLNNINLSVPKGEILSVVGPSGCGKSTLLRLIAGLLRPSAGSISIAGRRVAGDRTDFVPAEQRGVGLVFQDYALFPHLTAKKNVGFGLQKLPRTERQARIMHMLSLVGLADLADRYPHELSGGQQQRVALARALAPEPAVLLLDEPFSGLDAQTRGQVREQVVSVLKATGTTALMVTHDPDEAIAVGDRIAVLNHGELIQIGTPEQIYHQPVTVFVASLFGDINCLPVVSEGAGTALLQGLNLPIAHGNSSKSIALVRPERVRIAHGRPDATVAKVESSGGYWTVTVETVSAMGKPTQLRARVLSDAALRIQPGDPVSLVIAPDDVHMVSQ